MGDNPLRPASTSVSPGNPEGGSPGLASYATETDASPGNPEGDPRLASYDSYLAWEGIAAAQSPNGSGFLGVIHWKGRRGEEGRRGVQELLGLYPDSTQVVDLTTLLEKLRGQKPRDAQQFVTLLQEALVPIVTREEIRKIVQENSSPENRQRYSDELYKHYKALGYAIIELPQVQRVLERNGGGFRDKEDLKNLLGKLGIKPSSLVDSSSPLYLMPDAKQHFAGELLGPWMDMFVREPAITRAMATAHPRSLEDLAQARAEAAIRGGLGMVGQLLLIAVPATSGATKAGIRALAGRLAGRLAARVGTRAAATRATGIVINEGIRPATIDGKLVTVQTVKGGIPVHKPLYFAGDPAEFVAVANLTIRGAAISAAGAAAPAVPSLPTPAAPISVPGSVPGAPIPVPMAARGNPFVADPFLSNRGMMAASAQGDGLALQTHEMVTPARSTMIFVEPGALNNSWSSIPSSRGLSPRVTGDWPGFAHRFRPMDLPFKGPMKAPGVPGANIYDPMPPGTFPYLIIAPGVLNEALNGPIGDPADSRSYIEPGKPQPVYAIANEEIPEDVKNALQELFGPGYVLSNELDMRVLLEELKKHRRLVFSSNPVLIREEAQTVLGLIITDHQLEMRAALNSDPKTREWIALNRVASEQGTTVTLGDGNEYGLPSGEYLSARLKDYWEVRDTIDLPPLERNGNVGQAYVAGSIDGSGGGSGSIIRPESAAGGAGQTIQDPLGAREEGSPPTPETAAPKEIPPQALALRGTSSAPATDDPVARLAGQWKRAIGETISGALRLQTTRHSPTGQAGTMDFTVIFDPESLEAKRVVRSNEPQARLAVGEAAVQITYWHDGNFITVGEAGEFLTPSLDNTPSPLNRLLVHINERPLQSLVPPPQAPEIRAGDVVVIGRLPEETHIRNMGYLRRALGEIDSQPMTIVLPEEDIEFFGSVEKAYDSMKREVRVSVAKDGSFVGLESNMPERHSPRGTIYTVGEPGRGTLARLVDYDMETAVIVRGIDWEGRNPNPLQREAIERLVKDSQSFLPSSSELFPVLPLEIAESPMPPQRQAVGARPQPVSPIPPEASPAAGTASLVFPEWEATPPSEGPYLRSQVPQAGQIFYHKLRSGPNSVGRSSENDIQVLDQRVSRFHATFQVESGKVTITDLQSANGTMVSGIQVSHPTTLVNDTRVVVGDTYIDVLFPQATAPTPAPSVPSLSNGGAESEAPWQALPQSLAPSPAAAEPTPSKESLAVGTTSFLFPSWKTTPPSKGHYLEGRDPKTGVRYHELPNGYISVGKLPVSNVQIQDSMVSKYHALIEVKGDKVTIIDRGSSNGTWAKGARITKGVPVELNDGDGVNLGGGVHLIVRLRQAGTLPRAPWEALPQSPAPSPAAAEPMPPGGSPAVGKPTFRLEEWTGKPLKGSAYIVCAEAVSGRTYLDTIFSVSRSKGLDPSGVTIGTDPTADIHVDDPGRIISRRHATIQREEASGRWTITDWSEEGTLVNDEKLTKGQPRELNIRDIVSLGTKDGLWFVFMLPQATAPTPAPSGPGPSNGGAEPEAPWQVLPQSPALSPAAVNPTPPGGSPAVGKLTFVLEEWPENGWPGAPCLSRDAVGDEETPFHYKKLTANEVIIIGTHPTEADLHVDDPTQIISRKHATIKREPDGSWTITDHSTNGTWVGSRKIEKGIPVKLEGDTRIGLDSESRLNFIFHGVSHVKSE